jgi:hypothetical protein
MSCMVWWLSERVLLSLQYELVCGREWLVSFASTAYLLGALVGAFGCGVLSDK